MAFIAVDVHFYFEQLTDDALGQTSKEVCFGTAATCCKTTL
jgi:hypothetical protein